MIEWRVILDENQEPAYNMKLDEAILHAVISGESPPTIRFYGWTSDAITVGYHQRPEKVLDLQRTEAAGIKIITRPTGGRAVLHGNDLTYSISAPTGFFRGAGITESYRVLSEALAAGLAEAGVDVTLARGQGSGHAPGPKPCFASTARYELTWKGMKLVGSAQRRIRDGILQQGSIPLRDGVVDMWDLLPPAIRSRIERSPWATIEEILGTTVDREEIARSVSTGFCRHLGVSILELDPSGSEIEYALGKTDKIK